MAIALPSPSDLQIYRDGSDQASIQQAADLFYLATGVTDTTTEFEARIVKTAILDMAWAISVRHDDREAEFSKFSGERIGSYSYNKAAQAIKDSGPTGITAFDIAVEYFLGLATNGAISMDSEWVFKKGYDPNSPLIGGHDPASRYVLADPYYLEAPDNDGENLIIDEDGNLFVDEG